MTVPGAANVVARTGASGVVLVDGASAAASDALLKAVAALPGAGPVRTLFNTHWHPEQTGSNETLGKAGVAIIAHENTRLWLTTDVKWPWNGQTFKRLPKVAQPNKTFYTSGTLEPGIRYGHLPDAAHTDGDLYVYFEPQNVLVGGRRGVAAGLADGGLRHRRMDRRHGRRDAAAAGDGERADADRARARTGARRTPT